VEGFLTQAVRADKGCLCARSVARGCITFIAAALSQIRNCPTLCPLSYDVRTLLSATELGHDEILAFLIKSGRFRVDSKDSRDKTVLWWASRNGCEMSARLLLAVDPAMVNSKDRDNRNLLYVAAEQGNKAVVVMLLDEGADVNTQGGYYGNALYAASAGGHKEVVMLLQKHGASRAPT
jgi:ankyrin repeat protein